MKYLPMKSILYCKTGVILFLILIASVCAYAGDAAGKLKSPFVFVENKGQVTDQYSKARKDVCFVLKGEGLSIFFTAKGMQFQFRKMTSRDNNAFNGYGRDHKTKSGSGPDCSFYRVDWELEGASDQAVIEAEDPTPYREHYYLKHITGKEEITGLKSFRKLVYHNVYPGIDWVVSVQGSRLKYDFVVHQGADPDLIKIKHHGAIEIVKEQDGGLRVQHPFSDITEEKPVAFETATRRKVDCEWEERSGYWGYRTAAGSGTLTIDPGVGWAGYYGGDAWDFTYQGGGGIATDAAGCTYATGSSFSIQNLATTGAYQYTPAGPSSNGFYQPDIFLMKLDKGGTLLWSTFVGGAENEVAGNLALNNLGQLYLLGATWSETGISTPGVQQTVFGGPTIGSVGGISFGLADYALFRFDTSGIRIWGTYYGGDQIDNVLSAYGIAADDSGHVYIASETASSTNIASTGSYQPLFGGMSDAFVAKFDSSGTRLWGTYIGEADYGFANALSIGGSGNIYIAGAWGGPSTTGTAGTSQPVPDNGTTGFSGWLCKMGTDGSLIWNTYLHGYSSAFTGLGLGSIFKDWTTIQDIYADANDNIFVTGNAAADSALSTAGAYKTVPSGISPSLTSGNGFLAKYNSSGQKTWCSYVDGGYTTQCLSICGSRCQDNISVAGGTTATDSIATAGAPFTSPSLATDGAGFIMQFDYSGTHKLWGTYWGPEGPAAFGIGTYVSDIAPDNSGNLQSLGTSNKTETEGSNYTDTLEGGQDALVARFREVYVDAVATDTLTICLYPDGSGSLQVSYLVSADFEPGNVFSVELMPVANSSALPIVLNSFSGNTSGSITCPVAAGTVVPGWLYRLRVLASAPYTQGSCWQTVRFSLMPLPPPPAEKVYCLFDMADTLRVQHQPGHTLRWYSDSSSASYDTIAPLAPTALLGTTVWYVSQVNADGCASEKTAVRITILDTPAVHIETIQDRLCLGGLILLSGSGDGELNWTSVPEGVKTISAGQAEVFVRLPGIVFLTARNASGCKNVDSVSINPVECCDPILVPSAFSPNSDGLNDQLLPVTTGVFNQLKFSVFNRWGQRIFYSPDFARGWDGTFKGTPCDAGVYYYSLDAICGSGRQVQLKGDLSLIR